MLALMICVGALAHNPPVAWRGELSEAVHTYRALGVELHFKGGYFAYDIKRGERGFSSGVFGSDFAEVFSEVPEAAREAGRFRMLRAGATGVFIAGVVTIALSIALFPAGTQNFALLGPYFAGLGCGALLISGASGMFLMSPMFLSRAVAIYNDGVVTRALTKPDGGGITVGARF
jgi:hypothetical protein